MVIVTRQWSHVNDVILLNTRQWQNDTNETCALGIFISQCNDHQSIIYMRPVMVRIVLHHRRGRRCISEGWEGRDTVVWGGKSTLSLFLWYHHQLSSYHHHHCESGLWSSSTAWSIQSSSSSSLSPWSPEIFLAESRRQVAGHQEDSLELALRFLLLVIIIIIIIIISGWY